MNTDKLLRILPALIFAVCSTACSNSGDDGLFISFDDEEQQERQLSGCADNDSCASNPPLELGEQRTAQVFIPSDYTPTNRYPLIVVLHGFGANGVVQAGYLGLSTLVDEKQYILVAPDGTENAQGTRFWNATPACCAAAAAAQDNAGEDYSTIDDVDYLRSLIEEAAATYSIDTSRVGLFGHSNGGFMALRMACEASDLITSVISLAGSTYAEAASCTPATFPVSVLAIHGDQDETILYEGGEILEESYPGAMETTQRFAELAGCDTQNPAEQPLIDLDATIDGAETTVLAYSSCEPDVAVELWTIVGGPHVPVPWAEGAQASFVDWFVEP